MHFKYLPMSFDAKAIRDDGTFEGYASVFRNVDSVRDIVAPGAFAKTLRSGRRVKMLWQHDPAVPIGRWTALSEDSRGLHARGQILREIAKGNEAYALMKAEAVDGLSIGFRPVEDDIDPASGVRTLKSVDLFEISVVTFPANDMATIGTVKNGFDIGDLETDLCNAGLRPSDVARAIAVVRHSMGLENESDAAAFARAVRRASAVLRG